MTDAHQVLSRNPGDIQCQNGTSRVVETESSDEKSPDGGLQAWLVVLGSWCAMVPSMGLLNTIDVLHAWTATHQLTGYSESQIGWVFGTYAFFLYFGAAQIGPIFDSKGVLPVVVPESIGLIVSIFCFSESTEYYQVLFSFSILGGISSCCLFTPAISAIGHWFDIRRGLATGIACTAGGLGGVFFSLIVLYISPNLGFPWAMRIIAIISMAEWAYVLGGEVRITVFDTEGGSFIDDLEEGDLWYFPAGHPHSLQGLSPNRTEFLLVFDDSNFSEESTFLLTDWLARTPKSVLSENFRLKPHMFNSIPKSEKYVFQGLTPGTLDKAKPPSFKKSKLQFMHKMLAQTLLKSSDGQVRIIDLTNFLISKTMAAAHLEIAPGLSARYTGISTQTTEGTARTFDYMAGNVGIMLRNMGHYIKNLSNKKLLEVLEIFRVDKFQDFSLAQWLGETPPPIVADYLFFSDQEAVGEILQ